MKLLKKSILYFLFFTLLALQSFSQPVNIDQLSDEQISQYLNSANLSGLSEEELTAKAKQKGLSDEQIAKLKVRIAGIQSSKSSKVASPASVETDRKPVTAEVPGIKSTNLNIFGSELFSNSDLTFEPNLRIATPKNYILGVDDELVTEVYGNSSNSFKFKINPEGVIRVPNYGPLKIFGLTIEEAQQKIKSAFTKIYPDIAAGNTFVQTTLGQIRTIRVTLIGEVTKPGTYSLPSLATIANALYVSGGPSSNGSFRSIELVRNGKPKVVFDLYDFLTKGDLHNNLVLQDDDIIKVNPYKIRVQLSGAVKRQAIYEAVGTEKLSQIISYAGGFTDNVYKDVIRVTRNGLKEKEIITIPFNQYTEFALQSGDQFFIDNIIDRFRNRVAINGAVFHPGDYAIENSPDLKSLLTKAQLKEEAFFKRGIIRRLQEDFTPSIIDFNVKDVIDGKQKVDLMREDVVTVFSVYDVKEKSNVTINGEVNKPGTFEFNDSLTLQDILLLAGGFKEGASFKKIEISRRIKDTLNEKDDSAYSKIYVVELNKNIVSGDTSVQFKLEPFDIITIRKLPSYIGQKAVSIQGEVLYPGTYVLSDNNNTLTDLISRAGGLKEGAYPEGALLVRNTFQNLSDKSLLATREDIIKDFVRRDTASKKILEQDLTTQQKLVGIHLKEAIEKPNSFYNLRLEESDVLLIPKQLQTIQTFGAVFVTKKIVYDKGLTFKKAVAESGGFTKEALKKKSYVIYPNGEIAATKKLLFFKNYPELKPGAEIYVPLKKERKGTAGQEILGYSTAIVGLVTLLISVISLTK
jgi:protein involved in polysaccharide export with SLBB domain